MQPRMQVRYHDNVVPALKEKFEYSNVMLVPRLSKIVVNTSIREATQNVKLLEAAAEEIAIITGQKAIIRRARRSIGRERVGETLRVPPIGSRRREGERNGLGLGGCGAFVVVVRSRGRGRLV